MLFQAAQLALTRPSLHSLRALQRAAAAQAHSMELQQALEHKLIACPPWELVDCEVRLQSTQEVQLQTIQKKFGVQEEKKNVICFQWESQRINVGGFRLWEWQARVEFDQQLALFASDAKDTDQMNAELLGKCFQLTGEVERPQWLLAFLLSFPSDDAFDMISELLNGDLITR